MEKLLILSCFLTACSAIFFNIPGLSLFQFGKQSVTNICITSVNPARYAPKCFPCPTAFYPSVLTTCVSQATMPANVSYTQATCLEQNCALRRGKRSISSDDGRNSVEDSKPIGVPFGGVQLHQEEPSKDASLNYRSDRNRNDQEIKIDSVIETHAGEEEYDVEMELEDEDEEVGD